MRLSTLRDAARIARRSVVRRPVRSVLNALTSAVAIATVVTTMALIAGSRDVAERDLRALGLLTVQVHANPLAAALGNAPPLLEGHLAGVTRAAGDHAEVVVGARVRQFSARVGDRPPVLLPVVATRPGYLKMYDGRLRYGRWLAEDDVVGRRPVAVLDAQAARALTGRVDAVGERLVLTRADERLEVEVVGVLGDPFSMREQFQQFDTMRGARHVVARLLSFENVHVPLDLIPEEPYTVIFAKARNRASVKPMQEAMVAWAGRGSDAFFVWSRGEWIESVVHAMGQMAVIGNVLWMLILLVAMVMITAVTMVSVRERYPEVAVRRTEGATRREIVLQFTVEGMLLSLLGGVGGLGIGWASAVFLSDLVGWPPAFHVGDLAIALGMALLVGLGASVLPARRAARLDPAAVLSRRRR